MTNKILIKEHKDFLSPDFQFEADLVNQPGSPRVGRGKTPLFALIDLLKYNEEFNIEVIIDN